MLQRFQGWQVDAPGDGGLMGEEGAPADGGEFHDAMPVDWVASGESATVDVAGVSVAIANVDGRFCAFATECPHQATVLGGLSLQRGRLIRCPEHGSMFDVTTGECVLPSQDGWRGNLRLYRTRVVDDVVQVSLI
ncbi:MAG TPA: Rieske 2Fe-2S domain-containing protein [Acidimicrobiales bacterium]|nr:Rieske 2Fe-2S domain-containing protein [Acidimicrobiales bacterium]